ncbi:GNAT family N-acetyltransferase [Flindersiella endophytica]
MDIHPVTSERFGDLADLFETNGATRGCWCMSFRRRRKECQADWGAGNRRWLESAVAEDDPPAGLLAYRDGTPVGWCALGPRSRFPPAIGPRAVVLKDRDPAEDDTAWLVACFFTRVGYRKAGTSHALLTAAVELARDYGAPAIEGWPLAGAGPHGADRYFGTEPMFEACGFTCVARPTPGRAFMRRELTDAAG